MPRRPDLPRLIMVATILQAPAFTVFAKALLTFVFWSSGIAKLVDFQGSAAMMDGFGLAPGWLFNTGTIVLQIGGSLMIVLGRGAWLAALALAAFTAATVPIAHPFWAKTGEEAFRDLTVALEHASLIGGLALAATLSRPRRTPD